MLCEDVEITITSTYGSTVYNLKPNLPNFDKSFEVLVVLSQPSSTVTVTNTLGVSNYIAKIF